MKPPAVQHPPESPLPDRQDAVSYFGEIWLKYPLSEDLVRSMLGQHLASQITYIADHSLGPPPCRPNIPRIGETKESHERHRI
jgi:hypothetical protein